VEVDEILGSLIEDEESINCKGDEKYYGKRVIPARKRICTEQDKESNQCKYDEGHEPGKKRRGNPAYEYIFGFVPVHRFKSLGRYSEANDASNNLNAR
jgi:hypothetical protein